MSDNDLHRANAKPGDDDRYEYASYYLNGELIHILVGKLYVPRTVFCKGKLKKIF